MNLKDATLRALRTLAQGLAAAIGSAPVIQVLAEIPTYFEALGVLAFGALMTAVASFLLNAFEDNTSLQLPK